MVSAQPEIVELKGLIPPAQLEGRFGYDDFYSAEEVRTVVAEVFPEVGETAFLGLDYIAIYHPDKMSPSNDESRALTHLP